MKKTHDKGPAKTELARKNEELSAKVNELAAKVAEYTGLLQRLQADFENYKKRVEREKADYRSRVAGEVGLKVIDAYESLVRALDYAKKDASSSRLVAGIEGVAKQMESALRDEGIARMQVVGLKFNPALHEAVESVESDKDEDTVVEEVQSGYLIKDRVLRPAKVIVSRKKEVAKDA